MTSTRSVGRRNRHPASSRHRHRPSVRLPKALSLMGRSWRHKPSAIFSIPLLVTSSNHPNHGMHRPHAVKLTSILKEHRRSVNTRVFYRDNDVTMCFSAATAAALAASRQYCRKNTTAMEYIRWISSSHEGQCFR